MAISDGHLTPRVCRDSCPLLRAYKTDHISTSSCSSKTTQKSHPTQPFNSLFTSPTSQIIIMRADSVLFIATLLGLTEANRRQCFPQDPKYPRYGYYEWQQKDTYDRVKNDFCGIGRNDIRALNPKVSYPYKEGDYILVSCHPNRRECKPIKDTVYGEYLLQRTDSLWDVAYDFCIPLDQLKDLNKNANIELNPGTAIKVPCEF